MKFTTMSQIKEASEAAGRKFFSRGAMSFFRSRVETEKPIAGQYFVTSEQYGERHPRLFSVRKICGDCRVITVGKFQEHATLSDALAAIAAIVESN